MLDVTVFYQFCVVFNELGEFFYIVAVDDVLEIDYLVVVGAEDGGWEWVVEFVEFVSVALMESFPVDVLVVLEDDSEGFYELLERGVEGVDYFVYLLQF